MSLEKLNQKSYFDFEIIANMSHELRNPLNSILSIPELLLSGLYGNLSDKQIEFIQRIKESGNILLTLINDVLDISQIQIENVEFSSEPVELYELSETIKYLLKEKLHKRSITLEFQKPENLTYFISDYKKIKYILISTINSLIKYSDFVDILLISFSVDEANQIRISIKNKNGKLYDSFQEKLFVPFQKVNLNGKEVETGPGLFLSKLYIEKLGGSVQLINLNEIEFYIKSK